MTKQEYKKQNQEICNRCKMIEDKNIKCDKDIQKQCVLPVNSYGCKLRYFNKQCMLAIKEQKNGKTISELKGGDSVADSQLIK